MKTVENLKRRYADFQALDAKDKRNYWKEFALNNALYVLIIIAIMQSNLKTPVQIQSVLKIWQVF